MNQFVYKYDTDSGIVEPTQISREEIARAIFYMNFEYGAPIDSDMGQLLIRWHLGDPPSDHERLRYDMIEDIQGTRNPYLYRHSEFS